MGEEDGLVNLDHNTPTPQLYVGEGGGIVHQVDAPQRDRAGGRSNSNRFHHSGSALKSTESDNRF